MKTNIVVLGSKTTSRTLALTAFAALMSLASMASAAVIPQNLWHLPAHNLGEDLSVNTSTIGASAYSQNGGVDLSGSGLGIRMDRLQGRLGWAWFRDDSFPAGQAFEFTATFTGTTSTTVQADFLYGFDDIVVNPGTTVGTEWSYETDNTITGSTVGGTVSGFSTTFSGTISGDADKFFILPSGLGSGPNQIWGFFRTADVTFTPIPEPSTMALYLGVGVLALLPVVRRIRSIK